MTKFAANSKTIQLALALTFLTPVSLFAETPMTARQMLAQAQNQALSQTLTTASEIKTSTAEPSTSEQSKPVPPIAEASETGRMPVMMAAMPETSALTAPAEPVAPGRPGNGVAVATTAPDLAKPAPPSIASIVVLPAPPAATAPAVAPVATEVSTPAVAAPVSETQQTRAQPVPAAAANTAKPVQTQTATRPARERVANKRAHTSRSERSFTGGGAAINAQIAGIMRRPEVQSLLAQYGAN